MILYPFPPGSALKCGIAGFDEEKREPAAELYLLAPGTVPPAEFDGGYLFCEAPGCRDARLLQPVQTAVPDAPAVWCDTQVSGGNQDFFLNALGYLCQAEQSSLSIHAKSLSSDTLTMDSAAVSALTVAVVGVIPAAVITLGIVIWIRRKRR